MKRWLASGILVVLVAGCVVGNVTTSKVAEIVPIEPIGIIFYK